MLSGDNEVLEVDDPQASVGAFFLDDRKGKRWRSSRGGNLRNISSGHVRGKYLKVSFLQASVEVVVVDGKSKISGCFEQIVVDCATLVSDLSPNDDGQDASCSRIRPHTALPDDLHGCQMSRQELVKTLFFPRYTFLTSCVGMTCHARREISFLPNCNVFSVSSLFKCNPGTTDDKFIIF